MQSSRTRVSVGARLLQPLPTPWTVALVAAASRGAEPLLLDQREGPCPRTRRCEAFAAVVADTGRCDLVDRIQQRAAEALRVGEAECALDRMVGIQRDAARRQDELVKV